MTAPPRITADEALRLARAALEDERGATPGPWRYGASEGGVRLVEDGRGYRFAQVDDEQNGAFIAAARTREPALARFVEQVLTAPIDDDVRDSCRLGPGSHPIRCMGYAISVADARSLAAALLLAADSAERKEPTDG